MQVDVNSVVLAARIYADLQDRFFIAEVSGTSQQADGGEVMTVVRNSILAYVDDAVFGASKTNS